MRKFDLYSCTCVIIYVVKFVSNVDMHHYVIIESVEYLLQCIPINHHSWMLI